MRITFHRLARAELHCAADWYDARQPGLGADLYSDVERAIQQIGAIRTPRPRSRPGYVAH